MRFRWLAWVCVSSVWRSLDTPKSSLPFSSVCFQTWSFWSVPLGVFLTPFSSVPSPRQGQAMGAEQGKIPVSSSPYQPVCLDTEGFRDARCWWRSVFLLRLDWNDSKARVATVRAGEVPLPTSGLLESSTQHPFFLHSLCPWLLLSLCFLVMKTLGGTEGWLPHPHTPPTVCSHVLGG